MTGPLKAIGLILWVDGEAHGADPGVGRPRCVNCETQMGTGVTFHGNGTVCKQCLDTFRGKLFKLMRLSEEG